MKKISMMNSFVFGFILSFFLGASFLFADDPDSTKSTILERKEKFKAIDVIRGDTVRVDTTGNPDNVMPGGQSRKFTKEQDSAYYSALRNRIPTSIRLRQDLANTESAWQLSREMTQTYSLKQAIARIKSLPGKYFQPSGVEKVHFQENIRRGMSAPHIRNFLSGGLSVKMGDIVSLLGLAEDISPVIQYRLEYSDHVEIVIFSVNAKVIATIFEGDQPPGNYSITWNFRDDNGRIMPSGDYIAEVRIGKNRTVRKRIVIP